MFRYGTLCGSAALLLTAALANGQQVRPNPAPGMQNQGQQQGNPAPGMQNQGQQNQGQPGQNNNNQNMQPFPGGGFFVPQSFYYPNGPQNNLTNTVGTPGSAPVANTNNGIQPNQQLFNPNLWMNPSQFPNQADLSQMNSNQAWNPYQFNPNVFNSQYFNPLYTGIGYPFGGFGGGMGYGGVIPASTGLTGQWQMTPGSLQGRGTPASESGAGGNGGGIVNWQQRQQQNGAALLDLYVPKEAELYIQGKKMTQTGPERKLITPVLSAGQTNTYDIKVVWSEDGYDRSIVKTIVLTPGEHKSLTVIGKANSDKPSGTSGTTQAP